MSAWILFAALLVTTATVQVCPSAENRTFPLQQFPIQESKNRLIKQDELDSLFLEIVVEAVEKRFLGKAWDEVKRLNLNNDDRFIRDFVTRLYTKGTIYSTLDTLSTLNCTDYGKGVAGLYKELRKQDQLSNPELLNFERFLKKCAETDKNVRSTADLVKPHVDKILDGWAVDIQTGNYKHLNDFDWWSSGACLRIPDLVKKAVARNISHFAPTMKFINEFHNDQLYIAVSGLSALAQELKDMDMEHSEEMLLISHTAYSLITADIEQRRLLNEYGFERLLAEIPMVANQLFSMPRCTIKNQNTDEYLFAVGDPVYDGNGMVFTWIPGNKVAAAEWVLFPSVDSTNKLHFLIKNKALTNDTYFLCDAVPTNRVVTCNDDKRRSKWALLPSYWNGLSGRVEGFMVKNVGSSRYMQPREKYEHGVDSKRREVVISSSETLSSNHWQIECIH